jgi:hypothetical protein
MASKIAGHCIEPYQPLSAGDLRRAFETAVGELNDADLAAKRLHYRTPIFQRREIAGISQANTEERALRDAARALAQLWKI